MAKDQIRLMQVFPVEARRIYEAWLDSTEHTAFTGSGATIEPRVGGRHTAWDGYITGEILELEPGRRIVKSWRADDFPEGAEPSRLEVLLEPVDGGTLLSIFHTELPEGHGARFEEGWRDYYLKTMTDYFGADESAAPPAKKPAATKKRPAAKNKPAATKKKPAATKKKPTAKKKPARKQPARSRR